MDQWVAVDWGTSRLRTWGVGAGGQTLWHEWSDQGMGNLAPAGFEPALLDLVGARLSPTGQTRVVVCGMAGAREGWLEAPYIEVPCKPPSVASAVRPKCRDGRLDVAVLPGVSQRKPADVMRGEETQIAGYLARDPHFDGVFCLPGTHSKWARISAGEIVGFRTCMTGELLGLLADQSVLRHSCTDPGVDEDAFLGGVKDAMARPEALACLLFGIRAHDVLRGDGRVVAARARLAGLLIGTELAAMRRWWLGQRVVVAGAGTLSGFWVTAVQANGGYASAVDGDQLSLAGLIAVAGLKSAVPSAGRHASTEIASCNAT